MLIRCTDADIYYREMGSGPPIVLLHPFPSCHEFWLPAVEVIAKRYRVLLPDLRGHGASGLGEGPATMQKHAADIECMCRHAGVLKAVFAGVSIGGYILFEFWRKDRNRIRALVLANTRATADSPEGRAARLASAETVLQTGPDAFIDSMIPKLLGATTRRNRPDLVAGVRATMRHATASGIAAVQYGMAERPDSIPALNEIDVPTLVIAGEEDTLTPLQDAMLIHANIAHSRLTSIPETGHFAVLEKPGEAARIIRKFLDELPAA